MPIELTHQVRNENLPAEQREIRTPRLNGKFQTDQTTPVLLRTRPLSPEFSNGSGRLCDNPPNMRVHGRLLSFYPAMKTHLPLNIFL